MSVPGTKSTECNGQNGHPMSPSDYSFSIKQYWKLARLHKFPAGSDLIFWPATWGYVLGASQDKPGHVELAVGLAAMVLWGTALHSTGCVINDICDVKFDRQVERTKGRPLAAGTISMFGAWVFLLLDYTALFSVLTLVNKTAFVFAVVNIFPLGTLYPLMKRVTSWPQAWLGVSMNWVLPTAWLLSRPEDYKSQPMWALTFGAFCWTIFYDTIYACQDRRDDVKAGVKSTALLFGDWVKPILAIFGSIFVASLAYAGHELHLGLGYFGITVGGCAAHLSWQLLTLDVDDPKDCWKKFASNGNLGYIILGGMLADLYLLSGPANHFAVM